MLKDFEGKELECYKLYYFCNALNGNPVSHFTDYTGNNICGIFLLISYNLSDYVLLNSSGRIIHTFGMGTRCFKRVYE